MEKETNELSVNSLTITNEKMYSILSKEQWKTLLPTTATKYWQNEYRELQIKAGIRRLWEQLYVESKGCEW